MNIERWLIRAVALLALAFAVQLGAAFLDRPERTLAIASWANNPQDMDELVELSEQVVVGRVTRVERAQDLVVRNPDLPDGEDRIPVEAVTLQVVNPIANKGGGGPPETVQVFHTGLAVADLPRDRGTRPPGPPPEGVQRPSRPADPNSPEARTVILAGDPPYERGKEYVLFLRQGPELRVNGRAVRTQRLVSPEGRYGVSGRGTLEPESHLADFAQRQRGRSVEQIAEEVRAAVGRDVRKHTPGWERRGN